MRVIGNGKWNADQLPVVAGTASANGKPKVPIVVSLGDVVIALDRGNRGTINTVNGDTINVHFVNPDTGDQYDRDFQRSELTTLDGRRLDGSPSRPLPPIEDLCDLFRNSIPLPPELVDGILHKGSKLSFGGASKGFKTWTLDWLAIAVANGLPWLGFNTTRSKVLLIDMELQKAFCRRRLMTLQDALHITAEPGWLDVWNLRGYAASHTEIFPRIIERIAGKDYGLVVLDPIYKLYGDTCDENSAGDVAALMNSIESLTVITGAAVAFGSHFSKGNQAGKSAIDRVSGSGVFSRDPDSLLNLTAHAENDCCYTLDATLRNFPPMTPFVVHWSFPLFDRRNDLDPTALKKATGRPRVYSAEDLFNALEGELGAVKWQKRSGIKSGDVFRQLRAELLEAKRVEQTTHGWKKCEIKNPTQTPPSSTQVSLLPSGHD